MLFGTILGNSSIIDFYGKSVTITHSIIKLPQPFNQCRACPTWRRRYLQRL